MMKNKTPIIMGGVFILLVIVFMLTNLNRREVSQGAVPLFPEGLNPDIDRIEFTSTTRGNIVLQRQDGVWNLTKPVMYRVDENIIYSMLQELHEMQVDGVVTDDEGKRNDFEADDASGTEMKVYDGEDLLLDVVVGRHSIDMAHTYVWDRKDGDITLWRGLFTSYSSTDIDGWRDKTVYSFNPGDIIKVEVTDSAGTRVLNHPDTTWTFTDNGASLPVNDTKVSQYLAFLAGLRSDGFADEAGMGRVIGSDPNLRVTFTVRTGDIQSFDVWTPVEGGSTYYMRKENGDIVFRFNQYLGSMLMMKYEQLSPS